MNIDHLFDCKVAKGASESELNALAAEVGRELPKSYRELLAISNGLIFGQGPVVYNTAEVWERNVTFEFDIYLKDFLSIGDDSGGRSILISYLMPGVFMTYQGDPDPDDLLRIAVSLESWIKNGCLLCAHTSKKRQK